MLNRVVFDTIMPTLLKWDKSTYKTILHHIRCKVLLLKYQKLKAVYECGFVF